MCTHLGSRVAGLPVPLSAPAVRSGFAGGVKTATKLQSSTPRVAVLNESKFNHAEMLTSLMSAAMGDLHPKSSTVSAVSCYLQRLRFCPLCGHQKMGLIEALLGFCFRPGSRCERKALTSALFHNRCFRFRRKVGPGSQGKPRCCNLEGGPSGAVRVSSCTCRSGDMLRAAVSLDLRLPCRNGGFCWPFGLP